MKIKGLVVSLFAVGMMTSPLANATNGYFAHGYGVKSQGMGGVGIALPQDSLAAATNPAGMVMVGDRADVGVTWFRPNREAQIVGMGTYDGNDTENFFIPEFGYNKMMSPDMSLGVSVYGNGGMNTDYTTAVPVIGTTPLGMNLEQLFVAPTVGWKLSPTQSIGVSLNLVYQRFAAKGLENFATPASSLYPANVHYNGHDSSTGYGLHLGWIGQISDNVSLGATYQSKTNMGNFDGYRGLFAGAGGFDIPASYGVGIAVKANTQVTVAADIQKIQYSGVPSVNNLLANMFVLGNPLGGANGPGFGWQDITVYKLGVNYDYSDSLTLRAGYNHNSQPIPVTETHFNILAPGVVEDHLTLGATWEVSANSELSLAYMHAFSNTVTGAGSVSGANANLTMHQDSIGISYGWKY